MRKTSIVGALLGALLWWAACSSSTAPEAATHIENPVALTAVIDGIGQIVLVDHDNPTNFRQITFGDHTGIHAEFSHDKKKLVYFDVTAGAIHSPLLTLYSLESAQHLPLYHYTATDSIPVYGNPPVVWSPDDSRLYYQIADSWIQQPMRYDFAARQRVRLVDRPTSAERVIGMIGADTLIVFSNDTATTKNKPGFYLTDLQFNYLSFIDNPHLEYINRNGVNRKAAYNPEWNDEVKRLVYAQVDSGFAGYKIAVTNLDGSYYRVYTSGDHIDDHAAWGPEGKTILFDRRRPTDYSGLASQVMIIDVETGDMRVFVGARTINNATRLRYPDY